MERSQKSLAIQYVLSLVTASVVGVIINLACYLGASILFPKGEILLSDVDWAALCWVMLSLLLLFRYRIGMLPLILLSLVFGVVLYAII